MTNYNDGNWHVWQGDDCKCPVDDGARGDITYADGEKLTDVNLSFFQWSEPLMFRVTKANREPEYGEWFIQKDTDEIRYGYSTEWDVIHLCDGVRACRNLVKDHCEPREAYFAQLGAGDWLEVTPDHSKAVKFRKVLE